MVPITSPSVDELIDEASLLPRRPTFGECPFVTLSLVLRRLGHDG
jgi:hypothetical protein